MRDRNGLHSRVEMLGAVPHSHVRSVLVRGQIFVNRWALFPRVGGAASLGSLRVSCAQSLRSRCAHLLVHGEQSAADVARCSCAIGIGS